MKKTTIALLCIFIAGYSNGAGEWLESGGLVVLEAEHAALPAGWISTTVTPPGDPTMGGFLGDGYIEWTGAFSGGNTKPDAQAVGVITYTFIIATEGDYTIRWRTKQYSSVPSGDAGNDTFIKFATGSEVTGSEYASNFSKVWVQSQAVWSWGTNFEPVHGVFYYTTKRNFSAGTHSIQLAARSPGHAIDRIVLFHSSVPLNTAVFESAPESARVGEVNAAPSVDAGADFTVNFPDYTGMLDGTVEDDGLPSSGVLSMLWEQMSGPGTAQIASSNAAQSMVVLPGAGTYVFRLTGADGEYNDFDEVTVESTDEPVHVDGVSVSPTERSVIWGSTYKLTASVSPTNAFDKSVVWTSLNPSVATVDSSGLVSGHASGSASIVVTATDGGFSATNTMTVTPGAVMLEPTVQAGNLMVDIIDGTINGGFSVMAATNLLDPGGWTVLYSNLVFDAAGQAVVTNPAIAKQQFLKIQEAEQTGPITIEAENFDSTGGAGFANGDSTYGVKTYTVGPIGAINWVQQGDWAEYLNVDIPAGVYQVEYFTGTPVALSTIDLLIDGVPVASDNVPNNGNWDVFESLVSGTLVEIPGGLHTVRILGAGPAEWQWNLDRIILTKVSEIL